MDAFGYEVKPRLVQYFLCVFGTSNLGPHVIVVVVEKLGRGDIDFKVRSSKSFLRTERQRSMRLDLFCSSNLLSLVSELGACLDDSYGEKSRLGRRRKEELATKLACMTSSWCMRVYRTDEWHLGFS